MVIIHIDSSKGDPEELNEHIKKGKHVFILFYMEGCGPCNATRPEWKKLENVLGKSNNNVVIADVDQELLSKIIGLKSQPAGFPTMRYIKDDDEEDYEDSSIDKKDRSVDSFVEWIKTKVSQKGGKRNYKKTRKHKKYIKKGGKWSRKYKLSINCKRPKGFSQKQYCKYGRNKK